MPRIRCTSTRCTSKTTSFRTRNADVMLTLFPGWLRRIVDLPSYRLRQVILPRGWLSRPVERRHRGAIPSPPRRSLYVDLAVVSKNDAGTGIQRVVRALALALIRQDPGGWDIRFVSATRMCPYY